MPTAVATRASPTNRSSRPALLVVVEGSHDLQFLLHISRVLHLADAASPDLEEEIKRRRLVVLPVGGSPLSAWGERLAGFHLPEVHIYDSETEPETALREKIVRELNRRPGCFATLTCKRALENYLHPTAIGSAGGPEIDVADNGCVAELVARCQFESRPGAPCWADLTRRGQRRLAQRTKRWLHRWATPRMTPQLLDERDPQGEVRSWLSVIASRLT